MHVHWILMKKKTLFKEAANKDNPQAALPKKGQHSRLEESIEPQQFA